MKIQTFSIVAGTRACDAKCPFCVSRMTGLDALPSERRINRRNLHKAALLAQRAGTTTVLLTGKGEPTLYPDEITEYLRLLEPYGFPMVELQTNALEMGRLARDGQTRSRLTAAHLRRWHEAGLDTVAISVVDVDTKANVRVYDHDYPPLDRTVQYLHGLGYSVRLCVMMMRGAVDRAARVRDVVEFCRRQEVEQLTFRPIRRPEATEDTDAARFVEQFGVSDEALQPIYGWIVDRGVHLMSLMHGAKIFDVDGQNVCISDCLTLEPKDDNIRTLIFYSDGRVTYDWQHHGAILLGGHFPSEEPPPALAQPNG